MEDRQQFEQTLQQMGINPANLAKEGVTLPALPGSDPAAIQQNQFDGFYKVGAREFWKHAQVSQNKVQPFLECQHYLQQKNNEAQCVKCHVGWNLSGSLHVSDGKLFDGVTQLQFAP